MKSQCTCCGQVWKDSGLDPAEVRIGLCDRCWDYHHQKKIEYRVVQPDGVVNLEGFLKTFSEEGFEVIHLESLPMFIKPTFVLVMGRPVAPAGGKDNA